MDDEKRRTVITLKKIISFIESAEKVEDLYVYIDDITDSVYEVEKFLKKKQNDIGKNINWFRFEIHGKCKLKK